MIANHGLRAQPTQSTGHLKAPVTCFSPLFLLVPSSFATIRPEVGLDCQRLYIVQATRGNYTSAIAVFQALYYYYYYYYYYYHQIEHKNKKIVERGKNIQWSITQTNFVNPSVTFLTKVKINQLKLKLELIIKNIYIVENSRWYNFITSRLFAILFWLFATLFWETNLLGLAWVSYSTVNQ